MEHTTPAGGAWRVTVAGALALMAGIGFGRFSYTMLLPSTREGLGLSWTAAGLLATVNLAGYLLGSLLAGATSRRFGSRATGVGALLTLSVALAWMSITRDFLDASLARALAGVAGAIVYVQALGLVAAWFPERTRGLASGIMHTGNGTGLILTGLGLPWLVASGLVNGWRWGWGVLSLAVLATVPWAWISFRVPAALSQTVNGPPSRIASDRERRVEGPHVAYAILYGLFGVSYIIYLTFFAATLERRGLSLSESGLAWATIGTLSLMSGPLWGALSDRIGRHRSLAILFGVHAVAYLTFVYPSPWSAIISAVVFGTTAWGVPAIMTAAVAETGATADAMTALGRITTVMGLGQAAGPFLAGSLADATGIIESGLWISVIASLCGIILSLMNQKERRIEEGIAR